MGIGILALCFAGLCGLVSLAGLAQGQERPKEKRPDYNKLNPIEL